MKGSIIELYGSFSISLLYPKPERPDCQSSVLSAQHVLRMKRRPEPTGAWEPRFGRSDTRKALRRFFEAF